MLNLLCRAVPTENEGVNLEDVDFTKPLQVAISPLAGFIGVVRTKGGFTDENPVIRVHTD